MIVLGLIVLLAQALRAVVGLVPDWAPPTAAFEGTATNVGAMAAAGNAYFPVVTLGVCLVLVLGLKVALLVWRAVVFVYEVFPFKAT